MFQLMTRGKRGTLIDWLCAGTCLAVFAAVLYQAVYADWSYHGIPDWYQSYLRWEKRMGFPAWWPL